MMHRGRAFNLAGGLFISMCLLVALIWASQSTLSAQEQGPVDEQVLNPVMQAMLENPPVVQELPAMGSTACVNGMAGIYPCENVDLLSFTPIATLGGGIGSDAWGWTDSSTGKEYAIMTRSNGTAFVDISDPENPIYLGNLPTATGTASWRDAKVYNDYVYIVSDGNGEHGMQIFDLNILETVVSPPVTFTETAHYDEFGSSHNIVINEDSGFAYAVGVSSGTTTCSGGLHMMDLTNPTAPAFVGCHSASGYTHDAQCVMYQGPDPDHQGDEICFNSNGNTGLFVVDVTNKAATQQLSFTSYPNQDYTHQAWLTADHRYLILNDELDELTYGFNTRTRVFDVTNLDAPPVLVDYYSSPAPATDHNLYIRDGFAYEANYQSGLRVVSVKEAATGDLYQAGFFDTYTPNDSSGFSGAWTAYPYYESGVVIISSRGEGLFVVRPRAGFDIEKSDPVGVLNAGETITYTVTVTNSGIVTAENVVVTDTLNGAATVLSGPSTIAPGEMATYIFTYTIEPADCGTNLSNLASVSADLVPVEEIDAAVITPVTCTGAPMYDSYLPYVASE